VSDPATVIDAYSQAIHWTSYLSAISPIAIVVSAVVALRVGFNAIRHQRSIARRRATLDLLLSLESDPYYQKVSATFRDVRDAGGLKGLIEADRLSVREQEELLHVKSFINQYELICCGMIEDTLDELFYFQFYRGAFIHHWHASKDLVFSARAKSGNLRIFERFERFATAWENNIFVTRSDLPSSYMSNNCQVAVKQG